MKNYLDKNLNFVELGAKPQFLRKIKYFMKSERFDVCDGREY